MKNMIEDIVSSKSKTGVNKKIKDLKKKIGTDPMLKNALKKHFTDALNKRGDKLERLQQEVEIKVKLKELSEIISLSYIAVNYFGKKKEWLYHRINGNIINGKPATFTAEQKKQLNEAFKDISKKIGAVRV
ncbi:MAG: DUF5053 domain-containing protein [Agriterribacter sp.]